MGPVSRERCSGGRSCPRPPSIRCPASGQPAAGWSDRSSSTAPTRCSSSCAAALRSTVSASDRDRARQSSPPPRERLLAAGCPSVLVLDGVQDPRNLGAVLRTARALGVGGVVLPRDRSAGVTPVVVAAAAGLLFGLPIAQVPNLVRAMEALKAAGFWL